METDKGCYNCIGSGKSCYEEPCCSCISYGEPYLNWKPKEDTSERIKKTINDIYGVNGIKHIEDCLESVRDDFIKIRTKLDDLEPMLKDIQESLNEIKNLEKIEEEVENGTT